MYVLPTQCAHFLTALITYIFSRFGVYTRQIYQNKHSGTKGILSLMNSHLCLGLSYIKSKKSNLTRSDAHEISNCIDRMD